MELNLSRSYYQVIAYLDQNETSGIFSFPYDPIYYLLYKQIPPPYTTIYEGSPLYAQKISTQFLDDNIELNIIYNISPSDLVDQVPEYVRAPYLTKYILLNYQPVKLIDRFVIMEKDSGGLVFDEKNLSGAYGELYDHLLNLSFGSIPQIEGEHKDSQIIKSDRSIILTRGSNKGGVKHLFKGK
jgi:hypothetical protein